MQKDTIVDNLISIWQEQEVTKPLPAEGKSMYPLIKHGDTIYIKFCNPEKVKAGDIVAFRRDNTTIVHRLLKKLDSKTFLEKGDFQIKAQIIEKEKILGKVLLGNNIINSIMSYLGYLINKFSLIGLPPHQKVWCGGKPLLVIPLIINTISSIIYRNANRRDI